MKAIIKCHCGVNFYGTIDKEDTCWLCIKKIQQGVELVDNFTNEIMDVVRLETNLDSNSDEDDRVYTFIHNTISKLINNR